MNGMARECVMCRLFKHMKIDPKTGCWINLKKPVNKNMPYVQLIFQKSSLKYKKMVYAHRISYLFFNGPIGHKMQVCHTCDNPRCFNPKHLWLGTHDENHADKVRKGRSPYGESNGRSRLTDTIVKNILVEPKYISSLKLSSKYKISSSTIRDIRRGKKWKHIYRGTND